MKQNLIYKLLIWRFISAEVPVVSSKKLQFKASQLIHYLSDSSAVFTNN